MIRQHPTECGLFDPSGLFVCTEPKHHEAAHIALTDDGCECERWSDDGSTYPQASTDSKATS